MMYLGQVTSYQCVIKAHRSSSKCHNRFKISLQSDSLIVTIILILGDMNNISRVEDVKVRSDKNGQDRNQYIRGTAQVGRFVEKT